MQTQTTYAQPKSSVAMPASIPLLQTKLRVGTPGDRFEQEADDVASRIMASETGTVTGNAPIQIQRKCAACAEEDEEIHRMSATSPLVLEGEDEEETESAPPAPEAEEEESIHAKEKPGSTPAVTPALDSRIMGMRGGGRPLDESVRNYFEPRLGHDFSNVRVHDGAGAADATNALEARAFAVGNDLMFASGEYAPNTSSGRHLLAHELTHVVQQGAAPAHRPAMIQRLPRNGDDRFNDGMLPYREATQMQECQAMLGPGSEAYCREQVLGEMTASTPQPAPPPPVTCEPNRALTWADFAGPVPVSTFGAMTSFHFDLANDNGRQIIRAFLNASSWVKPQAASPTTRALNGCQTQVDSCVTALNAATAAGQVGAWRNLGAPTGCPASVSPNTALRATTTGQCETVLGTECDRVAILESARLLRHEQLHFSLACEMARKGTTHLFSNPSANAQTILTSVRTKTNTLTAQYDAQSIHGCNAAQQATWETNVANGLPAVTIP